MDLGLLQTRSVGPLDYPKILIATLRHPILSRFHAQRTGMHSGLQRDHPWDLDQSRERPPRQPPRGDSFGPSNPGYAERALTVSGHEITGKRFGNSPLGASTIAPYHPIAPGGIDASSMGPHAQSGNKSRYQRIREGGHLHWRALFQDLALRGDVEAGHDQNLLRRDIVWIFEYRSLEIV